MLLYLQISPVQIKFVGCEGGVFQVARNELTATSCLSHVHCCALSHCQKYSVNYDLECTCTNQPAEDQPRQLPATKHLLTSSLAGISYARARGAPVTAFATMNVLVERPLAFSMSCS